MESSQTQLKEDISKIKNINKCLCICRQNNKNLESNTTEIQQAYEREHYKSLQKVFSTLRKSNQP